MKDEGLADVCRRPQVLCANGSCFEPVLRIFHNFQKCGSVRSGLSSKVFTFVQIQREILSSRNKM